MEMKVGQLQMVTSLDRVLKAKLEETSSISSLRAFNPTLIA